MKPILYSSALLSLLLLGGCGSNSDDNTITLPEATVSDKELSSLIQGYNLTGDPSTDRDIPSIDDPQAQLGMKLFYSKALSLNYDSACVTCHHPLLGGGDDLSMPIGTEAIDPDLLGPGRVHEDTGNSFHDGGPTVPRNTPSTFNAALFDVSQFWDNRIESLSGTEGANGGKDMIMPGAEDYERIDSPVQYLSSTQALFPIISNEEMRGFGYNDLDDKDKVRDYLANRLSGVTDDLTQEQLDAWLDAFRKGFNEPEGNMSLITTENIAESIGEYERSQLFIDNPWKSYVDGDKNAISEEAKKGAILFYSSYENGGAHCVQCHSGDFFSNEALYVMAVPQIGRGKNYDGSTEDYGRANITQKDEDKYKFRVMSLLNISATGPWGHDGAFTNLKDIVKHMTKPETAENYKPEDHLTQEGIEVQCNDVTTNTKHALDQLKINRQKGISPHQSVDMTDEQIDQIVAFLETLTDPCVEDETCLNKWISDPASSDFEILQQLEARFQ